MPAGEKPVPDKPPNPDSGLIASNPRRDGGAGINIGAGSIIVGADNNYVGANAISSRDESAIDVSDLRQNPYPGLAAYTHGMASFYGGRESQVRHAVQRLTRPGDEPVLLFITGASGVGKSSFAQAGLLPALEGAYLERGLHVRWSIRRPGRYPVEALGLALRDFGVPEPRNQDWTGRLGTPSALNRLLSSETPSDQVNVLLFDQFEDLFMRASQAQREATIDLLSGLRAFNHVHTHVLAILQADFLPELFAIPKLFDRLKQDGIELRGMSSDELARAILRPIEEQARIEGKDKRLDPELVYRLVADVGPDPARLSLAQVTLRSLWNEPPHRMTVDRYHTITAALEQKLEQISSSDRHGRTRSAAEREQLMALLADLVSVSPDDIPRRDMRRSKPKQDIVGGQPDRAKLLDELIDAQLVTTWLERQGKSDVELVDIIHETVLESWPPLREEISGRIAPAFVTQSVGTQSQPKAGIRHVSHDEAR